MYKILDATFQNGNLILSEKLSPALEGKSFKVIHLERDDLDRKKQQFLRLVDKHSFKLPGDYQFNREQLHER